MKCHIKLIEVGLLPINIPNRYLGRSSKQKKIEAWKFVLFTFGHLRVEFKSLEIHSKGLEKEMTMVAIGSVLGAGFSDDNTHCITVLSKITAKRPRSGGFYEAATSHASTRDTSRRSLFPIASAAPRHPGDSEVCTSTCIFCLFDIHRVYRPRTLSQP